MNHRINDGFDLEDIGRKYGFTRERARQLLKIAIEEFGIPAGLSKEDILFGKKRISLVMNCNYQHCNKLIVKMFSVKLNTTEDDLLSEHKDRTFFCSIKCSQWNKARYFDENGQPIFGTAKARLRYAIDPKRRASQKAATNKWRTNPHRSAESKERSRIVQLNAVKSWQKRLKEKMNQDPVLAAKIRAKRAKRGREYYAKNRDRITAYYKQYHAKKRALAKK